MCKLCWRYTAELLCFFLNRPEGWQLSLRSRQATMGLDREGFDRGSCTQPSCPCTEFTSHSTSVKCNYCMHPPVTHCMAKTEPKTASTDLGQLMKFLLGVSIQCHQLKPSIINWKTHVGSGVCKEQAILDTMISLILKLIGQSTFGYLLILRPMVTLMGFLF